LSTSIYEPLSAPFGGIIHGSNPCAAANPVALFDSAGKILVLRRQDDDKWTMPGGELKIDAESVG
jgi:hypothetical protein